MDIDFEGEAWAQAVAEVAAWPPLPDAVREAVLAELDGVSAPDVATGAPCDVAPARDGDSLPSGR